MIGRKVRCALTAGIGIIGLVMIMMKRNMRRLFAMIVR